MSKAVLIESHYFPCVAYFAQILQFDTIIIDDTEKYEKQSYRNRCKILGANKVETLSIPVLKPNGSNLTKDIKIDYSQKWELNHIRSLQSAYGKAPFYPYFSDDLFLIINQKHTYLHDLNVEILRYLFKIFKLNIKIVDKSSLSEKDSFDDVMTLKNYINRKSEDPKEAFVSYYQLFGVTFEQNLSILDILYNEGINALSLMRETKI